MWCNSIKNTGKPNVSFFVQGIQSKVGREKKARTSVQLGQKLKHPTIEFAAINSSGLVADSKKVNYHRGPGARPRSRMDPSAEVCPLRKMVYSLVSQSVVHVQQPAAPTQSLLETSALTPDQLNQNLHFKISHDLYAVIHTKSMDFETRCIWF